MNKIVSFFSGGPDDKGRTLPEILDFSDAQFEAVHDFIQWIFPLHEKSLHSVGTPVLEKDDIEHFRSDKNAQASMQQCLARFKDFLGVDGDEKKYNRWARDGNHNLLRITRVIRSLRLFGMEEEAKDLYSKVKEAAKRFMIAPDSVAYWDRAMNEDVMSPMTVNFIKAKRINV